MLNTATSVLALLSKIEARSADRYPFFHEELVLCNQCVEKPSTTIEVISYNKN